MHEEICYLDATDLAARIRSKALSSVEVVKAHLERIDEVNPKLNAIVTFPGGAMERAGEAESAIMRGEIWGPLHGVPFTVKDCVDTAGVRTTRGSRLFADRVPEADAPVVTRLRNAGGIFIGKTNMPEFALWWETDNLVFGRTNNPWNTERTTGGSSGGEAAAIAAGLSPLGIGSDVGGSIREPAHYCGIVGLKATHGRIPLTGHWPDALLRYMHVGPMARTVRDTGLGLRIMAGADGLDPHSLRVPAPDLGDLSAPLPGLRVGWCAEGPFAPVTSDVRDTVTKAASALAELGCHVEPEPLASWERWSPQRITDIIFAAEAAHALQPLVTGHEDELAPPMQRRLRSPMPSFPDYLEAMAQCDLFRQDVARYFTEFDLLLCPTGPIQAHPHDSARLDIEGQLVSGRNALRATIPFDLTGSPAISVPFGWSEDGLPVGVQLVGRHLDEPTLLHAAAKLEALHNPEGRRPPV